MSSSDHNNPQEPSPYGEQDVHPTYGQENLQEHAFQNPQPYREASGFGFVALVAGLVCLAALSGIVIYSLLLAPSPPRQPILVEAEGITKQAPVEVQVKPEPNSNVGVFRMLRGEEAQQSGKQQSGTTDSLTAKPDATLEKTSVTVWSESNTEAEQEETAEKVEKKAKEAKEASDEESALKPADDKATSKNEQKTDTKTEQTTASASGKWYVQIAALESRAAADEAWAKLHDQLPELLYTQNYVTKAATLASGKRVWRLLLGPQLQQQAQTLCRELKTRARSCLVKKIAP